MYIGQTILVPLLLGLLFALLLVPVCRWFEHKLHFHRTLAAIVSMLIFISFIMGIFTLIGFLLTDKIAVGLQLNVGNQIEDKYNKSIGPLPIKTSTDLFGIGAFGRYYFLEVGSRFKTYTDVGFEFQTLRQKATIHNETTKGPKLEGFGLDAAIGANYFLTNKIAINFSFGNIIGYNTQKLKRDESKSINSFYANVNSFDNFFNSSRFGLTFKL